MPVELLDWMGDDISVVDAARVSFRKKVDRSQSPAMKQEDISLLYYLARHGHWSPFAHPQISFRVSTTIAVARQLMRHNVGLTVNEVSRRYVHTGPEFELPKQWRAFPPDTIKQGSGGVLDDGSHASGIAEKAVREAREAYEELIQIGVAPEQARFVLPMCTVTEWIWTGSLYAYIRVCKERTDFTAQEETAEVAMAILDCLRKLYPESLKAWKI